VGANVGYDVGELSTLVGRDVILKVGEDVGTPSIVGEYVGFKVGRSLITAGALVEAGALICFTVGSAVSDAVVTFVDSLVGKRVIGFKVGDTVRGNIGEIVVSSTKGALVCFTVGSKVGDAVSENVG